MYMLDYDYSHDENVIIAVPKILEDMNLSYENAQIVYYSTAKECLDAVVSGDADVTLQNEYIGNYWLQKPKYLQIELNPYYNIDDSNVIVCNSEENSYIYTIFSKCIEAVSQDSINRIITHDTLLSPYSLSTHDIYVKYKKWIDVIIALVGLCIVMLVFVIISIRINLKKIKVKNEQLAQSALQANNANLAKREFLTKISHDIRTPMNVITGISAVAREHTDDKAKMEDCFDKIDEASGILLNIVNDVLDMSAIESNKMHIMRTPFDMKKLLSRLMKSYNQQCREKGIKFVMMVNDINDEYVIGDDIKVYQILSNILSNAVKYTSTDGEVEIVASQMGDKNGTVYLRFVIRDTGCGISEEMMERLYIPFEQDRNISANSGNGNGLGLSITKNLVEILHGAINIESVQGEGTTVVIDLPFESTRHSFEDKSNIFNGIKVLVADADDESGRYMSTVLSNMKVEYEIVKSFTDICDTIRAGGYKICIIDGSVIDKDSSENIRNIRKSFDYKELSIIVATNEGHEYEQEMIREGADMIVQKPLFQSTLFNVLINIGGKYRTAGNVSSQYNFDGKSILVVEDNDLNMAIVCEMLKNVGANVIKAWNGKEAVEIYREYENIIDIILMDIQMPQMDGYEATRVIRKLSEKSAVVPIIALTANALTEDITASISAGMNAHISKPIDIQALYACIDSEINTIYK